jgi:hypothetical protein
VNTIPPAIHKAVRSTHTLGKLSREIGDVALEVCWAAKPEDRKALAQKLRALADAVENAQ